jgi:hypothetical protein
LESFLQPQDSLFACCHILFTGHAAVMSQSGPSSPLKHTLSGETALKVSSSDSSLKWGFLNDNESLDAETTFTQSALILQPWSPLSLREIYGNEANFQNVSSIDILTADKSHTIWMSCASDKYINDLLEEITPGRTPPYSLVVFFISLQQDEDASYFRQANISHQILQAIVEKFNINDAAVLDVFGRPDYWSSFGGFQDIGEETSIGYEFYCQHPRWLQKTRHDTSKHRAPCSVYLHHNRAQNTSYYVVSAAKDDNCSLEIRTRLGHGEKAALNATNPFIIHAIVSGLAFEQSKEYLKDVQDRLFSQIAKVNDYSKESNYTGFENSSRTDSRRQLEDITKQLHLVSQTCDSGIANAAMSINLSQDMLDAYDRFVESPMNAPASWRQTRDSMVWILKTWQCQNNWLVSYKARKDTAMNFVRRPACSV